MTWNGMTPDHYLWLLAGLPLLWALGWLLLLLCEVAFPNSDWLPVGGRWRRLFVVGLPFILLLPLLPLPASVPLTVVFLLTVRWWGQRGPRQRTTREPR